jgi:prolyl-tRNA synthetase
MSTRRAIGCCCAAGSSASDATGITWPVTAAPYEAVVSIVRVDNESTAAASEVYDALLERGVEVLLDDRDVRPGVKFTDADLIGIPWRITVGPKGLANGVAEVTERATMATRETALVDTARVVADAVVAARR